MHLLHDIHAVDQQFLRLRRAQGDVKHRAILGQVDVIAAKHGVDPLAKPGLFREIQQQFHGFAGDAVFGVIEKNAFRFQREACRATGVVREELPQMNIFQAGGMVVQRFEGRQFG